MPDITSQVSWLADVTLTHDARSILQRAASLATTRGVPADQCDAIDVLNALLQTGGTLAERSLRALNVDPSDLASKVPPHDGTAALQVKQVLLYASREAQGLGHHQVDSVHLLLALLYADSRATSAVLQGAGVTLYDLRRGLQASTVATNHGGMARVEPRSSRTLRRRAFSSLRSELSLSPIFLGLVAVTVASGAALWFNLLPDAIGATLLVFVVGGWIISLCIHEFSHAAVAYLGGDTSVAPQGYLSFNPVRYANPFLSVILPVVFLLLGGIGLPGGAVYINHSAIRSRVWDSAVSLAGPTSNLLIAIVIAAVFTVPGHDDWITITNQYFFVALGFLGFVQISAVVLNLIPIPGLDGFGILAPWMQASLRYAAFRFASFAMIGLFIAIWYLPPARDVYFQLIFSMLAFGNISPDLIYVALSQFPHL